MSNSQTASKQPIRKNWLFSLAPVAVAASFLCFFVLQRQEIFGRLPYSVLANENWLPYVWALVAILLLGLQMRYTQAGKTLGTIGVVLLAAVCLCLGFLLVGRTGWGQYQVLRHECLKHHYGISALRLSDTESGIVARLTDPAVGHYLHVDKEMLEHLALKRADLFARQPCRAALALGSLVQLGVLAEDLTNDPQGSEFALYALAGEVYRSPRESMLWLPQQSVDHTNHATSLIDKYIDNVDSLSDLELEALVFCVANFRQLVDDAQRKRVREVWIARVPELNALMAEGYRLADSLSRSLSTDSALAGDPATANLQVEEGYAIPYDATAKNIQRSLTRSLQTLIRLQPGRAFKWREPSDGDNGDGKNGDSDVKVKLKLSGDELYKYQRQLYLWRKKHQSGRYRRIGTRTEYRPSRPTRELVSAGKSETETVYGATVELQATLRSHALRSSDKTTPKDKKSPVERIEREPTLVYWHDYLRMEDKNADLVEVGYDRLSGRLWPIGIHESYLRSDADSEYSLK
ncbi:hypothetical protein [Planctomycetes bacterium K23_9]|uniref:Uncharacterized protein n=1 Tax=Stieleria marina TaxID=1930275 RepID=A0A517NT45_9BACT|nr:hypothetical protein K239x_22490 [Planctomycetes bacterium K23_9]